MIREAALKTVCVCVYAKVRGDTIGYSRYVASNGWTTVNNELESTYKETTVS